MNCDLHTHTNHSDGVLSPKELVLEAKKLNTIIALTDHNTVSGLPEFMAEAEKLGVTAVGGTELTTEHCGVEFHLLGLFIDPEHYQRVENLCVDFISRKELSNIDLVEKLCRAGYHIDYQDVKKRNVKGNVNRAHIAAELLNRGYVGSVQEAFEKLLDEKCGLYTPPPRLTLKEGIEFLRKINALPILAHPLKEVSAEKLCEILTDLIDWGLVGIETMHSSYSDEFIKISKKIAKEFNILESGGSDFHGGNKPGVNLVFGKGNLNISHKIFEMLLERKRQISEKYK